MKFYQLYKVTWHNRSWSLKLIQLKIFTIHRFLFRPLIYNKQLYCVLYLKNITGYNWNDKVWEHLTNQHHFSLILNEQELFQNTKNNWTIKAITLLTYVFLNSLVQSPLVERISNGRETISLHLRKVRDSTPWLLWRWN